MGPITLVHMHLCGHKLQYIYQLYSAMFRVVKRVLVANPLVRSHMMDTIPKVRCCTNRLMTANIDIFCVLKAVGY